jgi:hypothetical protein
MSEQPEDVTPDALARIMAMNGIGQVQRVLNQAIYGNVDGPDAEQTPVGDDLARAVDDAFVGPVRPGEETTT